jgi:hypothetical protein
VTGNEYNGQRLVQPLELSLKIEAAETRHAHIEHQTPGSFLGPSTIKKLAR